MAEFLLDKRSSEVRPYDVNFSEILGDTDTKLDSEKTTVLIRDSAGVDRTTSILQRTIFSGFIVTLILKDGIDQEDYTIFVKGVGDVEFLTVQPVRVIELRVRDTLVGNL